MKYILSIDGGGIRGIIPATILAHIEARLDASCHELFDIITGTSTGGIIACGLGKGISANDLMLMYLEKGKEIFKRNHWFPDLFSPKYTASGIDKILEEVFEDTVLSKSKTKLIIPAYDMVEGQPRHFKSWIDKDIMLKCVARATSAAPTYFPSAFGRYVDGGMFSNNPTINALVEGYKLWGDDEPIIVVSLGTGVKVTKPVVIKSGGLRQWAKAIFPLMFTAPQKDVEYMSKVLLGDNYIRIAPELDGANDAMDDASKCNMCKLKRVGEDASLSPEVNKVVSIFKGHV